MVVILTAPAATPVTWGYAPPSGLEPLTLRVAAATLRGWRSLSSSSSPGSLTRQIRPCLAVAGRSPSGLDMSFLWRSVHSGQHLRVLARRPAGRLLDLS